MSRRTTARKPQTPEQKEAARLKREEKKAKEELAAAQPAYFPLRKPAVAKKRVIKITVYATYDVNVYSCSAIKQNDYLASHVYDLCTSEFGYEGIYRVSVEPIDIAEFPEF